VSSEGQPLPKDGSLVSPTFLAVTRRMGCIIVGCGKTAEAHHFPSIGASGVRRDDRVIPVCRLHHDMAQTYQYDRELQLLWVDRTRSLFMERATQREWEAFSADRERWLESRVFVEVPS
jgi:hypothetical protein